MKNSNFQIRNEYYNSLSKSRHSSQTFRRFQYSLKSDNLNDTKTKFFNKIEKVCTTMSQDHLTKEIVMCRREIERLQKEILKKDKIVFEMKTNSTQMKEIQAELIEVYRIVYMYEGKMKEYEKELKRLQTAIASESPKDIQGKIQELLQSYRIQNCQLQGNLQQKSRIIWQLEEKLKKVESKYLNTRWKLSTTNRQINNPLKKQFPNLRNVIMINQPSLLEKEKELKHQAKMATAMNQSELRDVRQNIESNQQSIHIKQSPKIQQIKRQFKQENQNLQTGTFGLTDNISPNNGFNFSLKINNQQKKEKGKETSNTSSQKRIYYSSIKRHQLNRSSEQTIPASLSPQVQISSPPQDIDPVKRNDESEKSYII